MNLLEFIEQSNAPCSPQALFALLIEAAATYDFSYIAYGCLGDRSDDNPVLPYPAVMLNYPKAWQEHYAAQHYQQIDPVVVLAPAAEQPLCWSDLLAHRHLNRRQRRVFAEAGSFGLRSGLSVPLHGPAGRVAVVSFAADSTRVVDPLTISHLHALAVRFHLAFQNAANGSMRTAAGVELTLRERECLSWAALGKSSWDISQILGVSQYTVKFHLGNAMRKLDAPTRTVAVLLAMRYGLIDPAHHG